MSQSPEAILLLSFGGPERPEDVLPFLRNVARGRNIPETRLLEVAEHYYLLGGKSPINEHCRALKRALEEELGRRGWHLPVYWGNRNWHPFIGETVRQMLGDGVNRVLALVTSAFGSYSSCRRYWEELEGAIQAWSPGSLHVQRLRLAFNHPGFVTAMADRVRTVCAEVQKAGLENPHLIFTAHSIPLSMARNAPYVAQFEESCRLVAESLGFSKWQRAYQSRSGSPHVPWLEPDISEVLRALAAAGDFRPIIIVPIGFLSDHVEVLYDLDVEAAGLASKLGIPYFRASTVGTHPAFVRALCDMIEERLTGDASRRAIGHLPPCPDVCPAECCRPE